MISHMWRSALYAFLMLSSLHAVALDDRFLVKDAWQLSMPPTMDVRAGYFVFKNESAQDITVVGVESAVFTSVEMHRTSMEDGMMHMREVPQLTIAAGHAISFAPEGLHLMLRGVLQPQVVGDTYPITMMFDSGEPFTFMMAVVAAPMCSDCDAHGAMNHGAMNHGDMDHGAMNHGAMNNGAMDHAHHDH